MGQFDNLKQTRDAAILPAAPFTMEPEDLRAWAEDLIATLQPVINDTVRLNTPPGIEFLNEASGLALVFTGSGAVPEGTLLCDGSAVRRDIEEALFNVIGTTYGAGDGSTTFNLPVQADFAALATGSWVIIK
jgi:hypothetical protein